MFCSLFDLTSSLVNENNGCTRKCRYLNASLGCAHSGRGGGGWEGRGMGGAGGGGGGG